MIGVIAQENQHAAVREFFELFKTPWQFHHQDLRCDALLCPRDSVPETSARLILTYGALEGSNVQRAGNWQSIVDLGVDLFAEVEKLLTHGQPAAEAGVPTLDHHIDRMREILQRHEISFVEIPPLPVGHDFIACLTHDLDHPRLRDHFVDLTLLGFVARALFGSLLNCLRGRKTFAQVIKNYAAVLSLPFVHLGMARDFWNQFDRYREIEGDARSTFFVIPKQGAPGEGAPANRAAGYSLTSLADELRRLGASGCEIAVHGIDAWQDADKGRSELEKVREVTGEEEIGVRMHWLYFSEESPARLEAAGYSYDSTFGYNDAVGYRAGTTQVFKPLRTEHLLELPLNLMDTALFYRDRMDLSPAEAKKEIEHLLENATRLGGVLTVNWHDRSLAPERLWDQPYIKLVKKLKERGAWMPTAQDAVAWFRARRSARFEIEEGAVRIAIEGDERLPGFRLRVHHSHSRHNAGSNESGFTDFPFMKTARFSLQTAEPAFSAA